MTVSTGREVRQSRFWSGSGHLRGSAAPAILAIVCVIAGAACLDINLRADKRWRQSRADLGAHSSQALDLYREGQQAWETRTPRGLAEARNQFGEAATLDPRFARAYSGLARTLLLEREYAGLPDAQAYPQAEAAAKHALAIDPHLAEAHAALGFIDFYWHWLPHQAETHFVSAVRSDPADVTARMWYAGMLKLQRRYREGLSQIEVAQSLAPESTQVLTTKAMLELDGGQAAAGETLMSHLEAAQPQQLWPHRMRAASALRSGRIDEYLLERRAELAIRPDADESRMVDAAARGWASGGRAGMLKAQLKTQLLLYEDGRSCAYAIAVTYALSGDDASAILWLHRAMNAHQPALLGAFSDPVFARLRERPEMQDIRARIAVGSPV